MRVLIAGCGYVGRALAEHLSRGGHDVVGIRRRPEMSTTFASVAIDLCADAEVASWLGQQPAFDAAIFTVAASAGDERSYRSAYVDALASFQAGLCATQRRPPLLLFTSSTSVYHHDHGERVDEETPTAPSGFRGRIQLEAEALVDGWPGASCSLRLGGIYGPGRTRFAASVRDGRAASGPVFTNRIHRDDASGALAHLVERYAVGVALPATVLGVDDAPSLRSEVVAWLAERLGVSPPEASVGETAGKRCDNRRLKQTGFAPRYPSYREGYSAILAADPAFPTFTPP